MEGWRMDRGTCCTTPSPCIVVHRDTSSVLSASWFKPACSWTVLHVLAWPCSNWNYNYNSCLWYLFLVVRRYVIYESITYFLMFDVVSLKVFFFQNISCVSDLLSPYLSVVLHTCIIFSDVNLVFIKFIVHSPSWKHRLLWKMNPGNYCSNLQYSNTR